MTATPVNAVNQQDPFFEHFHGAGFSPMLVLFYTPNTVFSVIGIVFNFNCSLIYVTIRTKSLQNTCNLLIALDSFGSAMLELNQLFPFFIALSGQNYILANTCFWFYLPAGFGANTTITIMFYISVERLVSIVFPIWASQIQARKAKLYLHCSLALSMAYVLYNICINYQGAFIELANVEVRCHNGDIRPVWSRTIFYRNSLILLGMTTAAYLTIWFMMIRSVLKKIQLANTYNMHIIKALSMIMALILFGWILNGASLYFLPLFKLDPIQMLVAGNILSSFTIIASGGNAPILYTFSSEYRRRFRVHFKWLFKSATVVDLAIVVLPARNINI